MNRMDNMRRHGLKTGGFTLLEVVIAIMIFGFLLTYVTQLMNSQLKFYKTAIQKNEVEQTVRTVTTKIVDQIRFSPKTYYSYNQGQKPGSQSPSPSNAGIYSANPITPDFSCLVNTDPDLNLINSTSYPKGIIYLDKTKTPWELRYKQDTGQSVLLADGITAFALTPVASSANNLVKIEIIATNSTNTNSYRLVTWVGLYYGQ